MALSSEAASQARTAADAMYNGANSIATNNAYYAEWQSQSEQVDTLTITSYALYGLAGAAAIASLAWALGDNLSGPGNPTHPSDLPSVSPSVAVPTSHGAFSHAQDAKITQACHGPYAAASLLTISCEMRSVNPSRFTPPDNEALPETCGEGELVDCYVPVPSSRTSTVRLLSRRILRPRVQLSPILVRLR